MAELMKDRLLDFAWEAGDFFRYTWRTRGFHRFVAIASISFMLSRMAQW